jgi:hypothetical protein
MANQDWSKRLKLSAGGETMALPAELSAGLIEYVASIICTNNTSQEVTDEEVKEEVRQELRRLFRME